MILQGLLVPLAAHCGFLGQKEHAAMDNSTRKTTPDHQALRGFDSFHHVSAVIPVEAQQLGHLCLVSFDAPERALVREHHGGPLLSNPLFLGKSKPLLLHCHGEEMFLGCAPAGIFRFFKILDRSGISSSSSRKPFRSLAIMVGYLTNFLWMMARITLVSFLGLPEPYILMRSCQSFRFLVRWMRRSC